MKKRTLQLACIIMLWSMTACMGTLLPPGAFSGIGFSLS